MTQENHKVFYDINEVAARYGFAPSKLRHWEKVFPMLKPPRRGGDRIYSNDDVELLDEIVYLVEKKKHKLEAAIEIIESKRSQRIKINRTIEQLEQIKQHLVELKELIQ
ncbi:MAG: MerR family transcriptional regulator [Runella sp.]